MVRTSALKLLPPLTSMRLRAAPCSSEHKGRVTYLGEAACQGRHVYINASAEGPASFVHKQSRSGGVDV